jgi:hypothetical protein
MEYQPVLLKENITTMLAEGLLLPRENMIIALLL